MPLDPNKLYRKRSSTREAALFAAEWSAITFASMLAVLFLAWALALLMPLDALTFNTEDAYNAPEGNPAVLLLQVDRN